MKKKIALMVAFGCLGASAASVNYDILGRKGSKMNSPMVYRNVDYSKAKKNEQQKVGSSLETRALHRTGMPDDVAAIEGSFRSYQSNNRFSIKRHYYGNPDNCNNSQCSYDWNGYKNAANSVFIPVNEYSSVKPNYEPTSARQSPKRQSYQRSSYGDKDRNYAENLGLLKPFKGLIGVL